ncbi:hypothetical protein [Pseudoruegeria sp. HB172150]|uniref:hypothetical protein n=1 Tax=Pseudoruegeria sp. HB172150 TaxID=2721164 RepID=UPI00155580E8|nr:hypothetical protein [Pseudoruegeria sp. HB172150]
MNPTKLFLTFAVLLGVMFFLSSMKEKVAPGAETVTTAAEGNGLLGGLFGTAKLTTVGAQEETETDPARLRRAEFYGWKAKHPGLAVQDDLIVGLSEAVSGYPGIRVPQLPANHRILKSDPTCSPAKPQPGDRIANVSIGQADLDSGLQVFTVSEMAKDTRRWLEGTLRKSLWTDESDLVGDHAVPMVDVILTDASAPQYVVLQHHRGRVLWNIVPAKGVTISHVVMIGNGASINPAPGNYDIQHLATGGDCVPRVAREPRPTWDMYSRVGVRLEEYEPRARAEFAAYDAWFRRNFGQGAETGVVGFDTTQHVLVGPIPSRPEERVAYRPVTGATVLVQEADYVFTASEPERSAFLIEHQTEIARNAAGGDLAMLFPEPLYREAAK